MSYSIWGRSKERETRAFSEKAYRRQPLPAWDARWHGLSAQARLYFLDEVKGPAKAQSRRSTKPGVTSDRFPPGILQELTAAGFVEVEPARSAGLPDRVGAAEGLQDFATRVRALRRFHLLAGDLPSEFARYVDYAFYNLQLTGVLSDVLRKAGIQDYGRLEDTLQRYVIHHRWPGWVAQALKDPVAERVVAAVREAAGPIPLAELPGRIEGSDPASVRSALDKLVAHLALVEDVQPQTGELLVGFLPSVLEELLRVGQPRQRPPLQVCERPKEVGPDGSVIVNDLRAFLLEVVSEPPRLRQDGALFQKEVERFLSPLEPLPGWLMGALKWSGEGRLNQAYGWAGALQLIKKVTEGKQARLRLTPKGHQWLASSLEDQYAGIYDLLSTLPSRNDVFSPYRGLFYTGMDPFSSLGPGDMRFLGAQVLVLKVAPGTRPPNYWEAKPEDHLALRESLDRAWAELPSGAFHTLESVEAHLGFGEHNPLHLGLDPDRVAVYWGGRLIPPLEEQREEAARLLLDAFVRRRLIPLGCVRAALDDQMRLCIAREPRLDAYFGRESARSALAPASAGESRVVVQPDFSIVVIGLNPTPAAELAPFCERATRGGGQGALVLKLTRESVVKAVSHGLKPAEILDRLRRHASNEVPANVLKEVQDWSRWVRRVSAATLTVLRCPDRDTADRVMTALKRQAERVNDTLVALDQKKLSSAERTKLRDHGIVVEGGADDETKRAARPKRRRRY